MTRPSPTESEDSGDLKKDAVLDLYVVVELFVHRCVCGVRVWNGHACV